MTPATRWHSLCLFYLAEECHFYLAPTRFRSDNIDYVKGLSVIFRGLPSLQRLRPITSAWSHRQHAPVGKALKKVRFGSVRTAYDAIHACNAGPSFPHACPAALVHAARSCKPQEVQAGRSAMSSKH